MFTPELYTAGLSLVLNPLGVGLAFLSVFVGIIIGCLPGLTVIMGIVILTPLTYGLPMHFAILILIGVYVGGNYGGSISATLVNIPGTPAAVCTILDAFPMAKRGEAGRAIGIATVSSFIGGLFSVFILMFISPFLAEFALKFTSLEIFSLTVFGLSVIIYISEGSMIKGFISGVLGLLIAAVGADPMSSFPRFTFGRLELFTGIDFIIAMIGLLGASEILIQVGGSESMATVQQKLKNIWPGFHFIREHFLVMMRSSVIGVIIGAIPGTGATIAAIVAYGQQKRVSRRPEEMGKGAPEGIVAPETANNACTGGAMTTMLSLGIPGDAVTAIMIGAFLMHGLRPGPELFLKSYPLVSAIFLSMLFCNVMMMAQGLTFARFFASLLSTPKAVLQSLILCFCVVGSYSVNNSLFDVFLMLLFALVGYLFHLTKVPRTPMVLSIILGPLMESNLRRSITIYGGGLNLLEAYGQRPISLGILILTLALLLYPAIKSISSKTKPSGSVLPP
jgi:putative tricarboxylic transport membrane protein